MREFKNIAGEERLLPVPIVLLKEMLIKTQIPLFFQVNPYIEKLILNNNMCLIDMTFWTRCFRE